MPRLLTYNVHRCVGTDRRLDVDRIVAVIAEFEPDVVCLQELDVGRARTGGVDQAEAIADGLAMTSRFHPAMRVEAEQYGDAILTPHPERLIRADALPTVSGIPGLEPRGAIWSEIEIDGTTVNVMNTHLGLVPREQRLQAAALAGSGWVGGCKGPTLLAGDFNATRSPAPIRPCAAACRTASASWDRSPARRPSRQPSPPSASTTVSSARISASARCGPPSRLWPASPRTTCR